MQENQTDETIYDFKYKEIRCQIVFFTKKYMIEDKTSYIDGGIWNSYIYIKKDKTPKLFKKLCLKAENSRYGLSFNWYKLETNGLIEMENGISYYGKHFNKKGKLFAIQIGNDYNHIWNGSNNYESIKKDLEMCIDKFDIC